MANGSPEREVNRGELLDQAVSRHVAMGYRVESQSTVQAIMIKRVPAWGKVILCALFWWPGFFRGSHQKEKRLIIRIDDSGNALVQDA